MMHAGFVFVFACVLVAHCLPTRHTKNEEFDVKNSDYNNKDFVKDIKKEMEDFSKKEDAKSSTEKAIEHKKKAENDHKYPDTVAISNSDKSEQVSTDDVVLEKVVDKAKKTSCTEIGKLDETLKEKPMVKQKTRETHIGPISKQNPVVEQKSHETYLAPMSEHNPLVEQKSQDIAIISEQSEKVHDKDKEAEGHGTIETVPVKLNVKDRTDIDTIVTVFNNQIGVDKKFYFKTLNKEEGKERYRCKVGFTSGNVIFYYRCLLVSNGITGEGLHETAPFLFS